MKLPASYVALGDSFTEGLWDIGPDENPHDDPPVRGWADRLATALSQRRVAAGLEPLQYANLAVRGRLMRPILHEQVPQAIEMGPDLVSLVGGGNDALRPTMDPDILAEELEEAVFKLRNAGIKVLLCTGVDIRHSPILSTIRPRVAILSTNIYSVARRTGAQVLDLWGLRAMSDWRMWAEDRIHFTPEGHRRIANAALVALGFTPDDPEWETPPKAQAPKSITEYARWNAEWAYEWVGPWIGRSLLRTSEEKLLLPKRPELKPVDRP